MYTYMTVGILYMDRIHVYVHDCRHTMPEQTVTGVINFNIIPLSSCSSELSPRN